MVVLPLFPYLFLLFFFSIFLAFVAPSLLLQFLFFTSLVWSSLPFLSFSVFLCFCVLSLLYCFSSLSLFLYFSWFVLFFFFPRSLGLSLSFLNSHNPSLFRLFFFLFCSSLFCPLFLVFFYPPFYLLFPMVFISGNGGERATTPV